MSEYGTHFVKIKKPLFYEALRAKKCWNCQTRDLKYPVGLITADEVAYAGAYKANQANETYYLYNSSINNIWWFSSPYFLDGSTACQWYFFGPDGSIDFDNAGLPFVFRPTINLKKDVKFSGTGTSTDPYKIVTE